MLHVEAETCSSFCRSMLAVRRASMVSSTELLDRAEDAVLVRGEWVVVGEDRIFTECYFGTDTQISREVPAYELDQPEQYDRAPAVIVFEIGCIVVALGTLLIWAFT